MILKEIINSLEFSDIADYLIKLDAQAEENLYSFKEAFDLLRNMQAQPSDGIEITISSEDYKDGMTPRLSAYFKEDTSWEVMLSREVVIEENYSATTEEIAAAILWELTFWGFSPIEREEHFDEMFDNPERHAKNNPYLAAFKKLEQHHHDVNCQHKEDRGKLTRRIKHSSDLFWEPRRNGPKRHREKRQKLRLEYLEKRVNRWDLCESLITKHHLTNEKETPDKLREAMLHNDGFRHYWMESQSKPGSEIAYMEELIRDYFPAQEGTKSIVLASAPDRITRQPDFKENIWATFGSFLKIPSPKRYIWSTNDKRENIRIDILVFD